MKSGRVFCIDLEERRRRVFPALRGTGIFLAALGAAACVATAAEPKLEHLYPAAGQQGTMVSVTATGNFKPWPTQVWVDAPGITFQPESATGKFAVEIAKDAAPGPHLVRLYNPDGASQPHFFIVSTEPELLEQKPNSGFKSPQKIAALPATISGRLDKEDDVDSFAVTLKKGETFTAWVEAYVLASTFDGMLRIVDDTGEQFAFNHDGRTLDPYLSWEAPRDGTFVVQIMGFAYPATASIHFTGGPGCVYRLHLTTAPQPRFQFPPHHATDGPELTKQELNGETLPVPCSLSGSLDHPGDKDRFAFVATKQKTYRFEVFSTRAGTPLEAWLSLETKDGKQLARNTEVEGSRDPQLTWTASNDGTFFLTVGDVAHHGGPDYAYRLTAAEAVPSVAATAAGHSVTVATGKTSEIKVTIKRTHGFKARLQLIAKDLPAGVAAEAVDIPEKDGEVALKISADAGASAVSQPLRLALRETESGAEHPVVYAMSSIGEGNGVPQGYKELVINTTEQLWLTVSAETPNAAAETEAPTVHGPPEVAKQLSARP